MSNPSNDQFLLQNIAKEKTKRKEIEKTGNRDEEPNLHQISVALDEYYFINKMRLYCAYLSYKNIVQPENIKYQRSDLLLIKEIIQHIKSGIASVTLLIHYQISQLLETIDQPTTHQDRLLHSTFELIKDKETQHSTDEVIEMYSLLLNYCIRKMNAGTKRYHPIFLHLNNEIINLSNQENTKEKIPLHPSLFRNIVVVALSIKEDSFFHTLKTHGLKPKPPHTHFPNAFAWTESFIDFYSQKIENHSQAKFYKLYCQVYLEFAKKNFEDAYKIFENPMRVQGTFLNLDIKILHLKILFEINIKKETLLEYDKIEIRKVLDAYRKLINYEISKKRQLAYQISFYADFEKKYKKLFWFYYKFSGKLDNHKNPQFALKKQELEDFIKENNYSYNAWFIEKLRNV